MSNYTYEHRTVAPILNAIANWVKKYREAIGLRGELANCGAEEVARYARDIGVSPEELIFMVKKGPHAADELPKLLRALGVDPQKLASEFPRNDAKFATHLRQLRRQAAVPARSRRGHSR